MSIPRLQIELPIVTSSEANSCEHWSKKHKRHKKQKSIINLLISGSLRQHLISLSRPLIIKLIRISPRQLDNSDNLPMAFKYIKDYIADIIHPGLKPGRADEKIDLQWLYDQRKGLPKESKILVEIF